MTTNQVRMRALLDQQAKRRSEQQPSRHATALARGKWWGARRSSKMKSIRRRSA
jgi:hypothetical protein